MKNYAAYRNHNCRSASSRWGIILDLGSLPNGIMPNRPSSPKRSADLGREDSLQRSVRFSPEPQSPTGGILRTSLTSQRSLRLPDPLWRPESTRSNVRFSDEPPSNLDESSSSLPTPAPTRGMVQFATEPPKPTTTTGMLHFADDPSTNHDDSSHFAAAVDEFVRTGLLPSTSRGSASRSSGSRGRFSVVHMEEAGLSLRTTTLLVINYLSASYILMPHAFALGGTFLTCLVLTFVCFQCYVTSSFLLETCARAEAFSQYRRDSAFARRNSIRIRSRKFELSLLTELFLGKSWSIFFTITSALDLYGITWAFCSIFASAFAGKVPLTGDEHDYQIYVYIFLALTVPLSLTSILDQIFVQLTFLAGRMIMVLLMFITLAVAFANPSEPQFGTQVGPAKDTPVADFANIFKVIQIAVFSTSFQFSVPAVAGTSKNKYTLTAVFQYSLIFAYLSNLVLGLLVSIYFGDGCEINNNLNWINYHGGTAIDKPLRERSGLTSFVSSYIVLFAAIDGLSVFPLTVISLGDILMGTFYGEQVHEAENDWLIRTSFRLLACVPQTIGALFLSNLGLLATYAAVFTLLSYTALPALLYIKGKRKMVELNLSEATSYSHSWFSTYLAYGLLFAVSTVIVGVIVTQSKSLINSR